MAVDQRRERRQQRFRRRLGIALGIFAAVYVVFLVGMTAGENWVTDCVRSHTEDAGDGGVATVCDYRVLNGRGVDLGTPFAWLGIPHLPGLITDNAISDALILAFVGGWAYVLLIQPVREFISGRRERGASSET